MFSVLNFLNSVKLRLSRLQNNKALKSMPLLRAHWIEFFMVFLWLILLDHQVGSTVPAFFFILRMKKLPQSISIAIQS